MQDLESGMAYTYIGSELELFEKAIHWKQYYASFLQPYLQGDVLEVGAGIGGTTVALCNGAQSSWTCLEPDSTLAQHIDEKIVSGVLPSICTVHNGLLSNLPRSYRCNTAIYIDVLEHIEDDRAQLEETARYLLPNGYVIVLAPAYQWLYSPFDKAIGHYRRYTRASLLALAPSSFHCVSAFYLDSVGLCTSIANKLFLKQDQPTPKQIEFWDSVMIPIARVVDRLLRYNLGRSVIVIWQYKP
ncbi:MAG: class I SAM-dependent methyltransferase [Bacteroidota bacterium]|nr:class I SAM-dependent methyltransferase [Bacteroidota bacterium]